MNTIIFTGGGTGGHVYPGLAVHEALPPEIQRQVVWIGSRGGMEGEMVRSRGIPFYHVPTGKLRRYFDLRNVVDAFRVLAGIMAAFILLKKLDGKAVFSKGGFVAVPVVIAAWMRGIPVIIHESDADPGLATRITARFARVICVASSETAGCFPGKWQSRIAVTGNPVRSAFFTADPEGALSAIGVEDSNLPVVLVTGGSSGARQLNDWVDRTIARLSGIAVVVHQTGELEAPRIPDIAAKAEPGRYHGAPAFTDTFPALLRRADVVVARAGAGTIWEVAVTARPAILVPLSLGASRGDQIRNAHRYQSAGCAVVIDGPDAGPEEFLSVLRELLDSPEQRRSMSEAARRWASQNAAEAIATMIVAATGTLDYRP
jgi:UDP-N-acetylglucosamine--N-acetylmuramyl-(pentapeptide) pyrophosphoryl-undecaprenol N-acetylglucosamine transferase